MDSKVFETKIQKPFTLDQEGKGTVRLMVLHYSQFFGVTV